MKKMLKRSLALVLVLVQLVLLCGCDALDEMRENQVFFDENGDILWNGTTYKALPYSDLLNPELDYMEQVYVTEADVPVLLSSMLAQYYLFASTDGEFLVSNLAEPVYYCKASQHEALSARLLAPFEPDIVCYSYDVYDEETWEYDTQYYTLTQEQVEVIELVIEQVEPTVMGEGWSLDYDYDIWLEECSEDMLLRRNSMDIAVSGSTYYLFLYTDAQTLVFTVPDGCKAAFDGIVSAYMEGMGDETDMDIGEDLSV